MLERLRPALFITRREVRDQVRDWRIIFPVLGLTIFFPFLMNFTAQQILGFVEKYGATIIGERMVPFLMMIVGFFPISVSLVIALETFVGEKERGSIEPLLNAPLLDWQLYLGKLLAATVTPLITSYIGMAVYLIGLIISHVTLPPFWVLVQIIALTTVQAVMMVAGAVVVSSQTTSVRAANLLASFIIIPAALLIQGESIVMFWGNYSTLWWAVFGISVLTLLLVRVGLAHFRREELLGREIDILNVRWIWVKFWTIFRGEAHNIWDWYGSVLPQTVLSLKYSILLVALISVAGTILGYLQVEKYNIPLSETMLDNLDQKLRDMLKIWPIFHLGPVINIWWQNLRVLLLSMILGLFSLGILGSLPLMLSMGVAGYFVGLLQVNGLSMGGYLAFIIPHGIIEIPAAILATAAVFKAGTILATPTTEKSVGEVWLGAVADWVKVMVGIVIPLLLVAALIETWVTPRLALWMIK
jgi:uncharacterized membrane protein SpoIIM required for sporulation/ABC-type transport system involved in multi-copper enzyme maturation permease subunit